MTIQIIVWYDRSICTAKDFMKGFYNLEYWKESNSKIVVDGASNAYITNSGVIIHFLPLNDYARGYRADMCFVPEHLKDSELLYAIVRPSCQSNLVGFYDQYLIK